MNKEILDQIPADEQPVASTLISAAEELKHSSSFQWQLESQLMEAYKKKNSPTQGWFTKITAPVAWVLLALGGVLLLNWAIRSLIPAQPGAMVSAGTPVLTFADSVHQGKMCTGALTVTHNFSVAITNQDKTGFTPLDTQNAIGELRSFAWSPDGKQLAVVGNTTGSGNIYLTDSSGALLQPVLSEPLGYLIDVAWSQDGKQLLTWSVQNNAAVYVMNFDGNGLTEKSLGMQFFSTPQFTPDGQSIIFYGADSTSSGLFEVTLDGTQTRTISTRVEDESAFAWSPDNSRLAYIEMDRDLGEARLVVETDGNRATIATLPIPKGSGSAIPESANLSWSRDGQWLTFDFGRSPTDRAVYLAHADGSGLVQLAASAYAPAISADRNCLAYISNKQVFLLNLLLPTESPLLVADLPTGRAIADFKMDTLGWGTEVIP